MPPYFAVCISAQHSKATHSLHRHLAWPLQFCFLHLKKWNKMKAVPIIIAHLGTPLISVVTIQATLGSLVSSSIVSQVRLHRCACASLLWYLERPRAGLLSPVPDVVCFAMVLLFFSFPFLTHKVAKYNRGVSQQMTPGIVCYQTVPVT